MKESESERDGQTEKPTTYRWTNYNVHCDKSKHHPPQFENRSQSNYLQKIKQFPPHSEEYMQYSTATLLQSSREQHNETASHQTHGILW